MNKPLCTPTAAALGSKLASYSAIHLAASLGFTKIVQTLLERFPALLNHSLPCEKKTVGPTPLHCAAQGGHLETVRYLLEKRADYLAVANDPHTRAHCEGKGTLNKKWPGATPVELTVDPAISACLGDVQRKMEKASKALEATPDADREKSTAKKKKNTAAPKKAGPPGKVRIRLSPVLALQIKELPPNTQTTEQAAQEKFNAELGRINGDLFLTKKKKGAQVEHKPWLAARRP